MNNIREVVEYINCNSEYLDGPDIILFPMWKSSIESRPEMGGYLAPDDYLRWLEEDIQLGRLKKRVEVKKMLVEQQRKEEQDAASEDGRRKKFEELRNIERDSKGRLNKGAKLAKKDTCNKLRIYMMHEMGATVKEIVTYYGCSKSTVYRVLAKHK